MADDPAGTAATATATTEPASADTAAAATVTDGQLGDGGKAALAAEREARKAEEKARKAAEKAARDAQAKLDELTAASQSEQEKAIEQARKEAAEAAKAEVTAEFRSRVLKSEIRAKAAGKFADPDDAIRLLELDEADVFSDDGEVQGDVLTKELDALLDRKPHLKADPSNGRPIGDVDAGKGVTPGPTGTPEEQHNQWLAGVLQQP